MEDDARKRAAPVPRVSKCGIKKDIADGWSLDRAERQPGCYCARLRYRRFYVVLELRCVVYLGR